MQARDEVIEGTAGLSGFIGEQSLMRRKLDRRSVYGIEAGSKCHRTVLLAVQCTMPLRDGEIAAISRFRVSMSGLSQTRTVT